MWGGLMGGLGGIGAQQTSGLVPFGADPIQQSAWPFLSLLVGIVAGVLFGAILGFVIGIGISEEDTYQYSQSLKHGQILFLTVVENAQTPEAQRVMAQIKFMPQVEEVAG